MDSACRVSSELELYDDMSKYHLFWNGVFSQWYPSKFTDPLLNNQTFTCCEQHMMYSKAKLFDDKIAMSLILESTNPKQQKAIGRKVRNFDDHTWNKFCLDIVTHCNYLKFSQNEQLKQELLNTGDKIIVEASPYDAKWGIGFGVNDPEINDVSKWGDNLLGVALMKVRDKLKND